MKKLRLSGIALLLAAVLFNSCGSGSGGGTDPVAMAKKYIQWYYIDYNYREFIKPFMKEGATLSPDEVAYYERQREIVKSLKFTTKYEEHRTQIDEATARVSFYVASEVDPEYNESVTVRLDKNKKDDKWYVTYFVAKEFKAAVDKFVDYFDKGVDASEKGNYRQAIDLFHKAIIADPDNMLIPSVYHEIGMAYYDMKDYERAAMSFEVANEGELKFAKSYYAAGLAYDAMKEFEKAVASYKKAIETDPESENNKIIYAHIGLSYQDMGEVDESIGYFKEAARLGNEGAQKYLRENNETW